MVHFQWTVGGSDGVLGSEVIFGHFCVIWGEPIVMGEPLLMYFGPLWTCLEGVQNGHFWVDFGLF